MADTILTVAFDLDAPTPAVQLEHPLTGQRLRPELVPGSTSSYQVALPDVLLPSPYPFKLWVTGKLVTKLAEILDLRQPVDTAGVGAFNYPVTAGTKSTSAGVYQMKNGEDTLVRTLWGAKPEGEPAANTTNRDMWDGRLDDLSMATAGTYNIKVLSHATDYKWEGVFGNSSFKTSHVTSGNFAGVRKGFSFLKSLVQVGDYLPASKGYVEGGSPMEKFHKDDVQPSINIFPYGYANGAHAGLVATDGVRVYTAYEDAIGTHDTWVSAYTPGAVDTPYTFSGGVTATTRNAQNFPMSACGYLSASATAKVIGLAAQRTGNFLFICHGGRLDVLNKLTGALVTSNTSFTNPRQATVDSSDNLWLTTGANTVARYTVNSDGSLSAATLTLSGPINPLCLAINTITDGSSIVVGDGAPTRQQYTAYSTATGAVQWTMFQAGGYYNTPDVVNDRVYLTDVSGSINHAFAAFTSDGGIFLGDPGNFRLLRFNSARAYVDQISYLPASYCSAIDGNNSKRQFHDYLEFEVTPENPIETRGKLVRNWRCSVPRKFFGFFNPEQGVEIFGVFASLHTLSNGRTYGTLKRFSDDPETGDNPSNKQVLVELPASGVLRFTSVALPENYSIGPDGNIYWTTLVNRVYTYWRRALTGFNAAGDPQYGPDVKDREIPVISDQDPVDFYGSSFSGAYQKTTSGKRVSFQSTMLQVFDRGKPTQKVYGRDFHAGLVAPNGTWSALFARATSGVNYIGDYPTGGEFDNGNHAPFAEGYQNGYAGNSIWVLDNETFWGYYGEFWKDDQTNKWQHGHESGLHIATWGPTGVGARGTDGRAGMAGGVHIGNFYKHPTDASKAYLMHTGENGFFGLHQWAISGRDTIKVETVATIQVTPETTFAGIPTDWVDLFKTFPYASNPYSSPAFAKNYTEVVYIDPDPKTGNQRVLRLGVRTNLRTYDRFKSPGVSQVYYGQSKSTVTNDYLFPAVNSASWKVKLNVNYTNNQINEGFLTDANSSGVQLEFLDEAGLAVIRFNTRTDNTVNPNQDRLIWNGKNFAAYPSYTGASDFLLLDQDFLVERVEGGLQLTYANLAPVLAPSPADAGANMNAPVKLRVTLWHKGTVQVRDHALHINSAEVLPAMPVAPPTEYAFALADASVSRIDTGVQDVLNVSTNAQLKTLLSSDLQNKKIVLADGTYTDNFEQTGTWSNVWLTSASGNTTITSSGYSVLLILQGSAVRMKVRISHIKFTYTGTGNAYALLYWNELGTINGLEIDHCAFTSPNGNVNALGCSQYSVASKQGGLAKDVYIHDNDFKDIGRIAIELLNQGYDKVRLTNLRIDNNTFSGLGLKDARHGMAISLSGLIQRVGIKGNVSTGGKYCIYELVNVLDVLAEDNSGMSQDISILDEKPSPCAGWSISKDPTNPAPKRIYIKGGTMDVAGRPIQIYDAESVFVDGGNQLWKGHRGVQMNLINSTLRRLNLLIQSTVKEPSLELTSGTGNTFRDSKISSAGSAAGGYMPAYEAVVARSGTSGNSFLNLTTELGRQANGQPFAPSPETGADGRIVDQGSNNTIVNNIKSVVA